MATLYDKIRTQHTTGLDTEIKDFLPIIGNEIPNKLITNFDENESITLVVDAGTVTGVYDYKKSYQGNACYKMNVTGLLGQGTTQLNYSTPINLLSLSESSNNYSDIIQTGKYGNDEDKLFLILNAMVEMTGGANTGALTVKVFNGTKFAYVDPVGAYSGSYTFGGANLDKWIKIGWEMNNTTFVYANGFLDADWENVTKIEIVGTSTVALTVNYYFQNLWSALPAYNLNDNTPHIVANSYYPDVNETNSIYVSWSFGNDINTGQSRDIPVKTIQQGITNSMAIAGRDYVVILDSYTYKPLTNNQLIGIKQTLTDDVIIIADYLETPVISIKPENLDKDRMGARTHYRTFWAENLPAGVWTGTTRYVDSTGVYPGSFLTITLAHAAAGAGDCIEIVNSATYDESLTITKDIIIQAAPNQKPIWIDSATNNQVLVAANYAVRILGIIFQGETAPGANVTTIDMTSATGSLRIKDCTFTNIGEVGAFSYKAIETAALAIIENCLFTGNAAKFIAISKPSNSANALYILNNLAYLKNGASSYFVSVGRASAATLNIYIAFNELYVEDTLSTPYAFFFSYADALNTANPTDIYMFFNKIYGSIFINYLNNQNGNEVLIKNNVFYRYASSAILFAGTPTNAVVATIESNLFIPVGSYVVPPRAIEISTSVSANFTISYNKNIVWGNDTSNYNSGFYTGGGTIIAVSSFDNNIFLKTNDSAILKNGNFAMTANNNIYLWCETAIENNAGTIVDNYGIYYGNTADTAGVGITQNDESLENPEFLDLDNLNFGWYFDSILETRNEWIAFLENLFYPTITAAETLAVKFIETEGYYGKSCFETNDVEMNVQYCTVKDFTAGLNSIGEKINILNSFFETNSIAARINNSIITEIIDCKNNIFYNNNTAMILRSGIDFDYNTILGSDYGLCGIFTGFYSLDEYISDYVTIQNSILYESSVYDYYYTLPTDYCIIGSRYYDELPATDINYKVTKGDNDYSEKPWLNDNYFPATVYEGYLFNSIAYLNDSAGTGHIGAKNENHIKAVFVFTAYTLNDNPYVIPMPIRPIHQQSIYTVLGEYKATKDAFIQAYIFNWTDNALITAAMRTQLELIFQTSWIVGISFDNGVSYNYFKVITNSEFTIQQSRYLKTELPFGQTGLELVEIPGFDIANYEINTF